METKKHIIAIVGESGSGKTLASQLLTGPGCKTIVSYTTRPMREGEINGVDHWFVDNKQLPEKEEICAYTLYGGYHYWTTWSQFQEWHKYYFAYVIDEKGLVDLMNKPLSLMFDIIPIKIVRPNKDDIDRSRKDRDIKRISLPDVIYDFIINNDGTLEEFKNKVKHVFNEIKNRTSWQHQKMNR